MKFSIIIPLKEFNKYLKESIPHLLKLNYSKEEYEIIILPNDKPKNIPKYLQDERIKIYPTGKVSPAIKRDMAASKASGEILAFIDDDSYPKDDWLSIAEKTFKKLSKEFVAINGPAITPNNATTTEKISGAFFESSLGGGATCRCRDNGKSFEIDDVPSVNLLVRRLKFLEIGGFGSEYWPGEDSLFCQKLNNKGYKIWHQNNLIIYHHRRDRVGAHLKQVVGYGKHRGNFFRKGIGCSRKIKYLIPSLFLIGNSILFIFWIKLWLALFLIYFAILFSNFYLYSGLSFSLIFSAIALTFVSHLTYGASFIKGFFIKDIVSRLR